jgi:ATP-dependent RNA helicase SUPV3L1/SUV3
MTHSAGPLHLQPRITAVLGPTNTGKTFFAVERMLAHKSGMIGLPLRLLAREVYDRILRERGSGEVALITGEEKIVPKTARFYVCTVEAMPLDIPVACLVIDEIQLCADPERGHVFTERLLNARGQEETMFLGSDTMRGAIQRFVPGAWFAARTRLSDLAYTGSKKLTRLPRRSAVVGFSADDVYAIAEVIRRQRGGAAVVLGALSPRTRNAQVALYQSGDVDFLVATDAIGMGLNMDVDHVAFAAREKFDGARMRPLNPQEIGQIAGRAGRFRNDGTFGVTAECEPFESDLVGRIETHRYDPVRVLQWRNPDLDFRSLDKLVESLDAPPPRRGLARARPASDAVALRLLSADEEVKAIVTARAQVARLWDVCQLPDFRKLSAEEHARLVRAIFLFLSGPEGAIPDDWLARQIARADVTQGDVATLSGRLAQIRTFTYAAHRAGWTRDGAYWQDVTRTVEDRLSDALHERLTQRFIDRRTSVLMKHLREEDFGSLALDEAGGVSIGGEAIGRLDGLRFVPDPRTTDGGQAFHAGGIGGRTLRAAAVKGLEGEFALRLHRLAQATDDALTLSEHGKLWWDGAIVGRLAAGPSPLAPNVLLLADDHLKGVGRDAAQDQLSGWMRARIAARLAPLIALREAADAKTGETGALPGMARGIAHQLAENFGALDRAAIALPAKLGPLLRALRPFGVWMGRRTVYVPRLLRPDSAGLLALLWGVWTQQECPPAPPAPGLTSFAIDGAMPADFLHAAGFACVAGRAIRFDMLERLEDELEKAPAAGTEAEALLVKLVSLLGSGKQEGRAVLDALGWRAVPVQGAAPVWRRSEKPRRPKRAFSRPLPDSPFAGLAALIPAK